MAFVVAFCARLVDAFAGGPNDRSEASRQTELPEEQT